MEERVPPTGDTIVHPLRITASHEPQDTYVVKVPRDQVYRIPPPEHARILENYRNAPNKNNKHCFRPCCWIFVILFLLLAVGGASVLIINATLYNPKPPEFSITNIHTKNFDHNKNSFTKSPVYEITLCVTNLNEWLSVTYRGAGKASLIFKNTKIGQGGIAWKVVEEPRDGGVIVPVNLFGKGLRLSSGITKSLVDTKDQKIMHLKIEVPMEINSWVKNEIMDLTIACDFKVKTLLMSKTNISFQECQAKF